MRIQELDGLRGIAVPAVVSEHYLAWLPAASFIFYCDDQSARDSAMEDDNFECSNSETPGRECRFPQKRQPAPSGTLND